MPGDVELPFDIVRIDAGGAARYACDDSRRPQVYQHVPRFAQHHGLVAVHAVGIGDCDGSVDCIHVAT